MKVMEALKQIYTFALIPWKAVRVRQSFLTDVVRRQCHHARVAAELLPQLRNSGEVVRSVFGFWIDLEGKGALETGCESLVSNNDSRG
jgi:hypothetical protein